MLTFLKLGGSLITDKTREGVFLQDRAVRLADEISAAWSARAGLRLLIGHGSGSFGHFAARKHRTMEGVSTPEQWRGFAEVGRTAARLNRLMADALAGAGLPIWPIQPSASAECSGGSLKLLEMRPIRAALDHDLIPLVYGDVALDTARGGTIISTETIFFYLAPLLRPQRVLLFGDVEGVLDESGQVIRRITPGSLPEVEAALGGSRGVDVTGGMASKVRDMVKLVERTPDLTIHILSGLTPGLLHDTLLDPDSAPGTAICAD